MSTLASIKKWLSSSQSYYSAHSTQQTVIQQGPSTSGYQRQNVQPGPSHYLPSHTSAPRLDEMVSLPQGEGLFRNNFQNSAPRHHHQYLQHSNQVQYYQQLGTQPLGNQQYFMPPQTSHITRHQPRNMSHSSVIYYHRPRSPEPKMNQSHLERMDDTD